MEQLQQPLTIASATIEEWTHRKTKKDGLKVNFTVSAPLPKVLAEQLKCGGIYDNDTKRVDLTHKLKEVELIVPVPGVEDGFASFFPDVLYAFHATRDEQQFTIDFSVHVTTRAEELHEIFKGSSEVMDLSLRPRQGQLFGGGTRVDMTSPAKETAILTDRPALDTGCIACNNEIPMADGSDTTHASGQMCTRSEDGAPLAAATTMGGTHQKRKPRADRGTVN